MADESVATLQGLLRDQRGPLVEALRWGTVLMSELERGGEEHFDGEMFRVGMILNPLQGGGWGTETGILNSPELLDHAYARLDTGIANITVGFTTKGDLATRSSENSWIRAIPDKMDAAEMGLKRNINESMCGSGDALIAAITGSNTTTTVAVANANFYQLYANRKVDVLVRSTGAVVALGVKIDDFDEDAGTVTIDSALTTDNTMGFYLQGSYGNATQGILQAVAQTGNFQNLSKTSTPAWRGVDASPSDVTDPTLGILDRAERRAAQRSGRTPDFYLGDPAVIDRFVQGLSFQSRWAGDDGQLSTGWEGVKYRNKLLIREFDMAARTLVGITKEDIKIYTRMEGPDWDEQDGSMFKRFSRSLPFEAWLVWHFQLGFRRCITQVKIGNLGRAE